MYQEPACSTFLSRQTEDENHPYNLSVSSAQTKRQQLQIERDLLDAQLHYLEELEIARRSGSCHTRAVIPTIIVPTTVDSRHTRCSNSTTSKPRSSAPHCFRSKATKSSPSSSEASTVELSTSSHSMRRECNDSGDTEDFQDSFHSSFNDLVVDTVITCDDSRSFCSGITMPLTPQEELDHFICTEIPDEGSGAEIALLQRQHFENRILPGDELLHRRQFAQDRKSGHQDQERPKERQKRRHQRKSRATMKSRPSDQDDGDAQPGRARNMSWLIAFDDGKKSLPALYSGPLVKGLPYGIGTLRMKNGDMYMGEIVWGAMHGTGTYWSQSDAQVCRGQFVNNVFQKENEASGELEEVSKSLLDELAAKAGTDSSRHARQCKRAIRQLTRMLVRLNEA